MAQDEDTDPAFSVQRAADGSCIVLVEGGGEIRFFASGTVAAKTEAVVPAARRHSLFDDDAESPVIRKTMDMPALVPGRRAIEVPHARAGAPLPPRPEKPVAGPLLWIRSREPPDPEHLQARPWLVEAEGLRVGLLSGYTYSVGRDDASDIRIVEVAKKGDTVSRNHASLAVIGSGLQLIDGNSRNGTYVGDERVRGMIVLRQHSDLFFGKFALTVRPAPEGLKVL